VVSCRCVSFGGTVVVSAPSDNAEGARLPKLRLCVLHHQGRTVVHDGVSRPRGRREVRQLRGRGHGLALVGRGQALRLRRPRKLLASRYPYSPNFVEYDFSRKFSLEDAEVFYVLVVDRAASAPTATRPCSALRRSRSPIRSSCSEDLPGSGLPSALRSFPSRRSLSCRRSISMNPSQLISLSIAHCTRARGMRCPRCSEIRCPYPSQRGQGL
jgi:hypothetical protein